MKSKLNLVVRDATHPCKPYASTSHSFIVGVFNCDMSIHRVIALTGVGPGGGNIYGELEVPSGCYIIVAVSRCKNVWTNWTMVVAGCGQDVCVNLIPRKFELCANEMSSAIIAALSSAGYNFSSPAQDITGELKKALERAKDALLDLRRLMPKYKMPISSKDLSQIKAPADIIELWKELEKYD